MNLNQWAIKWGIPYAALVDLRASFGIVDDQPTTATEEISEAGVQSRVRLEAAKSGNVRLWRNNVGAAMMKDASALVHRPCRASAVVLALELGMPRICDEDQIVAGAGADAGVR